MKNIKVVSLLAVVAIVTTGCYNQPGLVADNSYNRTKTGAVTGALAGAAIGYNTKGHHKGTRAAVGALIGALVGGGTGYYLDEQANAVAKALGTGVSNDPLAAVDPNRDIIVNKYPDYVRVIFRDKMMFATNSSKLQPSAVAKVNKLKAVLMQYPQTTVGVAGFTDSRGGYEYNKKLSEARARSVANLLVINGKKPVVKGCSYNKPLIANDTPEHMALNRRVEVYLYADPSKMSDPCK